MSTVSRSTKAGPLATFSFLLFTLQILSSLSTTLALPLSSTSADIVPNRGCATFITARDRIEHEDAVNLARRSLWDELELNARDLAPGANASIPTPPQTNKTVWRGKALPQIEFRVYWHVLYANETAEGGYVSDKQIADQMEVLNRDFKSTNISFNFINTTRIHSEDWFVNAWPGSEQEAEMKRTYHKGSTRSLNIFTAGFNSTDRSLGYASLPSSYFREPLKDGVMIRHTTLPGGAMKNYNLGRTTVHEIGHWLGLYHTFEGGCTGVGDNVADTAPESSGAEGCPIGRKSCPDSKLADPIHNFMDYSFDSCMTHFTPGQAIRMHESIWAFRTPRPPVAQSNGTATSTIASTTPTSSGSISSKASAAAEAEDAGQEFDEGEGDQMPVEEREFDDEDYDWVA